MPHIHKTDAKTSSKTKMSKMVGPKAADRFIHPEEKADNLAYFKNEKLDPLMKPNRGTK